MSGHLCRTYRQCIFADIPSPSQPSANADVYFIHCFTSYSCRCSGQLMYLASAVIEMLYLFPSPGRKCAVLEQGSPVSIQQLGSLPSYQAPHARGRCFAAAPALRGSPVSLLPFPLHPLSFLRRSRGPVLRRAGFPFRSLGSQISQTTGN